MTPEELGAIEARVNAATPGPWYWWMSERPPFCFGSHKTGSVDIGVLAMSRANAEFIASARADVPALIAEIRRLQEQVELWSLRT